jgi:transcriptional regulator with XRE-family HTH domain
MKGRALLAWNLRRLREAKGISQQQFAGKFKMDRAYISAIENGHRRSSLDLMDKLAAALDVPVHELLLPPEEGVDPPKKLPSGRPRVKAKGEIR